MSILGGSKQKKVFVSLGGSSTIEQMKHIVFEALSPILDTLRIISHLPKISSCRGKDLSSLPNTGLSSRLRSFHNMGTALCSESWTSPTNLERLNTIRTPRPELWSLELTSSSAPSKQTPSVPEPKGTVGFRAGFTQLAKNKLEPCQSS